MNKALHKPAHVQASPDTIRLASEAVSYRKRDSLQRMMNAMQDWSKHSGGPVRAYMQMAAISSKATLAEWPQSMRVMPDDEMARASEEGKLEQLFATSFNRTGLGAKTHKEVCTWIIQYIVNFL